MQDIVIQTPDEQTANQIHETAGSESKLMKSRGFDGIDSVFSILIVATPFVIHEVNKLVCALIGRKKEIRVFLNGIEIKKEDIDRLQELVEAREKADEDKDS